MNCNHKKKKIKRENEKPEKWKFYMKGENYRNQQSRAPPPLFSDLSRLCLPSPPYAAD